MSAAVLHDLAHLEVAIRNAYNGALEARQPGPLHWTEDLRYFPYRRGRAADGRSSTATASHASKSSGRSAWLEERRRLEARSSLSSPSV